MPQHLPAVWITWNDSRRSRSLSAYLGMEYVLATGPQRGLLRHLRCALLTGLFLLRRRPTHIVIQYSYLLLVMLRAYQLLRWREVRIVADCHNKAMQRRITGPASFVFESLKRWSFGAVSAIWVASAAIEPYARRYAQTVEVVPDPMPPLTPASSPVANGPVVMVGAYAVDEPLAEVFEAARRLPHRRFAVTGRIPPGFAMDRPANVELTDFLSEQDFVALVSAASVVCALTTDPTILQSAAYEAVALHRPLIISDFAVGRERFGDAALYVHNDAASIATGIEQAFDCPTLRANAARLAQRFRDEYIFPRSLWATPA